MGKAQRAHHPRCDRWARYALPILQNLHTSTITAYSIERGLRDGTTI